MRTSRRGTSTGCRAGTRDAEIVLERLLQRMYVIAPRLESGTAVTAVRRLAAALPRRLPAPGALEAQAPNVEDPDDPHGARHTVAQGRRRRRPHAAVARRADRVGRRGAAGGQFTVSADELATLTDGTFSPSATLADTADLADRVAGFARARDALWGKAARESVTATSAELLARNPALRSEQMKPLTDLIAPDGSISTTTAAVQAIEGSGVRADEQDRLGGHRRDRLHRERRGLERRGERAIVDARRRRCVDDDAAGHRHAKPGDGEKS